MTVNDAPVMLLPDTVAEKRHWGQLYGSAEALAISELAARSDTLLVVVVPSTLELLQLEQELTFFCGSDVAVHVLSDWETLTYDRVSPHQDIISQRIRTLYALPTLTSGILLLTSAAMMQRLPPRSFLEQHALIIKSGDTLKLDEFRVRLVEAGYRLVTQVEEHGEFAVRGSILDLFPMSSQLPFRVEFFDDEIETIRTFDPDTQRGLKKAKLIELLPAHEFPLNEEGIARFRRQYRTSFAAESKNTPIYHEVSEGRAPSGIEYYLPLFFDETSVFFDYLSNAVKILLMDGASEAFTNFAAATADRYEERRHDVERPILPPASIYISTDELDQALEANTPIELKRHEIEKPGASGINFNSASPGLFPIDARAEQPMGALADFLGKFPGRVLMVAESTGRREVLLDQLMGNRLAPQTVDSWQDFLSSDRELCLTTAPLDRGLTLPDARIALDK